MFARAALRSTAQAAARRPLALQQTLRANSVLAKYGLDDWKLTYPIGFLMALPIIHNQVIILSEETQLVGCFAFFCGTVYNLASGTVGDMLDKRGKDIQAQHNAVEDAAIEATRDTIKTYEDQIAMLSQLTALTAASKQANVDLAAAKTTEFKHATREEWVKKLDLLASKNEQIQTAKLSMMVSDAASAVTDKVLAEKEIQDKALQEAILTLEAGESKRTLVADLFTEFFVKAKEDAAAASSTPIVPDAAQTAHVKDQIAMLLKKEGIDGNVDDFVPASVTK